MDFKKPRVAIYYDVLPSTGYRNDGMPLFMHYNFRRILDGTDATKDKKVMSNDSGNVVHLSPLTPTAQHGSFDLNVLVDYGEDALNIPLDWEIPHPNAYWVADSHLGYEYRLKRAKQFDHVFLVHKAQIPDMIRDGIDPAKIHYLPCAAEETCYRPYPIIQRWDWSFIGHLNSSHRVDLLDRFVKEFGLGDGKGYLGWRIPQFRGHNVLDDAAKKYSQSRIVVNDSIRDDLNMRTLEAMACKTLLLTQDIEPIHELFKDGEHLVLYKSIDEAVELARKMLADPERRAAIAEAGYKEVLDKHTYNHRAREILKTCIGYETKGEHLATATR